MTDMARPKKTDSVTLVKIVDEFYEKEANGDPTRLKFSLICAYAEKIGYEVKAYDFRRDEAVRKRVDELTQMVEIKLEEPAMAYKSLDIDQLIRGCATLDDLKKNLYELDQYWKKVYVSACESDQKSRRFLAEKSRYEREIAELKKENSRLSEQADIAGKESRSFQRENVYLRRMLKTHLYPNLANEILRESHLPVPENTAVRPESFPVMIEGSRPLPFDGAQLGRPKPVMRQEQLMEEMRRQVQDDGK